jgi:hypothetical protein
MATFETLLCGLAVLVAGPKVPVAKGRRRPTYSSGVLLVLGARTHKPSLIDIRYAPIATKFCIAPKLTRIVPTGDIARREAQLSHLEHVHGETIGVNLASRVVPKAIHLIALDTFDGHQWSS